MFELRGVHSHEKERCNSDVKGMELHSCSWGFDYNLIPTNGKKQILKIHFKLSVENTRGFEKTTVSVANQLFANRSKTKNKVTKRPARIECMYFYTTT